jgi:hypothetical protein
VPPDHLVERVLLGREPADAAERGPDLGGRHHPGPVALLAGGRRRVADDPDGAEEQHRQE